ncbi:DUF1684 domain-containing protein [Flavobacteriaceae bacterium]|nr:DUF1684 domain-containing protein [Flavobacteriaceae bacterium]MDC0331818.1 DUF1684 domain-containing protein [Flavobacteriaceae bacterium]
MKYFLIVAFLSLFISCNSQDKRPLIGKTEYQQKLNAVFKDASKSPLKNKDLKRFKGLDFFPVDSSYIIIASIEKTSDTPFLGMATNTEEKSYYRKFGILTFTLKEKEMQLTLYESLEESENPVFEDYLFLPFTDETSGSDSYGGGRYMDVFKSKINTNGTLELNFNNTYNPYCAYNDDYSCPLTPRDNHLSMEILAGVKDFKKY